MDKLIKHAFLMVVLTVNLVYAESKVSWKDVAEVSLVSANGNTKATTLMVKNSLSYLWPDFQLELSAGALGSRSEGEVISEQFDASEKVIWKWTGLNYLFQRFRWDKNRFAGIENRYDLSFGLGRVVLDLPKDKLLTELGVGYINEQRAQEPRNDFASGRVYGKYTRVLSETSGISQDVEYLRNFEDASDYRLSALSSLESSISTYLSLKVSYQWKRTNRPPKGFIKDDTITSVVLIYRYGND